MTEVTKNNDINALSIKAGLFTGLILVVLSFVLWIVDPLLMFTNAIVATLYGLVVPIVLFVVVGIDVRKKIGGFWSFGSAFKSLAIMCFITLILTTIYGFVLFKYIDPTLPAKANSAMYEAMNTRLTKMNVEQSKIDEITKPFENGENEAKMKPTLANMSRNFGFGVIIYAILSLIIAAIIKKKQPVQVIFDDEAGATSTV